MTEKWRNIRVLCEIDLEHFDADNVLRIANFSALPEDIQEPLKKLCKIVGDGEDKFLISAQKLAKFCSARTDNFELMFDTKTLGLVDAINYSIHFPTYERDEPHNAKIKHLIVGHKNNCIIKSDSVTFRSNGTRLEEKDFQTFVGVPLDVVSSQDGAKAVFEVRLKNQDNIQDNTLPQLVLMLFGAVMFDPKEFKTLDSITMGENRFSFRGNGAQDIHLPFGR